MDKIKELRAKRLQVWESMKATLQEGDLDGERRTKYEAAEADFDKLTAELEARERAEAIEARMNAPVQIDAQRTQTPATSDTELRDRAFRTYLTRGVDRMEPEERAALEFRDLSDSSANGAAGGYTIPQGFLQKITERLKYFGPMRQVANVIQTASGQDLPWPTNDDTSNVGSILGENQQISELDVTFGQNMLKAYVWTSGLVRVPNTLLNDTAFDLETWLAKKFGQRLGRGQNQLFTVGTGHGNNQPAGLATTASSVNADVTTAATTNVAYADLLSALHGIDPAYRDTATWQFSDSALKVVRAITDAQGRPLFVPAGSFGTLSDAATPDTLLGKPIRINSHLNAWVNGSHVTAWGLFGDFSAAYVIRDVVGIQMMRLTERYADYLQTGFFAYMRTDGIVDDVAAYVRISS